MLALTNSTAVQTPTVVLGLDTLVGFVVASGLIAVIATFAFTGVQDWRQNRRNLRKMAELLGYEIASIKVIAKDVLVKQQERLGIIRKGLVRFQEGSEERLVTFRVGDPDFPRTDYDRSSTDLSLFKSDLAASISELYRWVTFTRHMRDRTNDSVQRFREISMNGVLPKDKTSRELALIRANQIETATQEYVNGVQRLVTMSQTALEKIGEIVKIDSSMVAGFTFDDLAEPESDG